MGGFTPTPENIVCENPKRSAVSEILTSSSGSNDDTMVKVALVFPLDSDV